MHTAAEASNAVGEDVPRAYRTWGLYPGIRLLLPVAVGIMAAEFYINHTGSIRLPGGGWVWIAALASLCGWLICWQWCRRASSAGFAIPLFAALAATGFYLMLSTLGTTVHPLPPTASTYAVRLTGEPQQKPNSLAFSAELTEGYAGKLLLYVAPDSLSALLKPGDRLLINTAPTSTLQSNEPGNGYRRYLLHHGISATVYVTARHWQRIGHEPLAGFRPKADLWQKRIAELYDRLGLAPDEAAVLAALTVGEKENLNDELRATYSVAGVSHVLALSGMHIALIALLLTTLLKPLSRSSAAGRWTASILVAGLLWAFALFTGASASVVRAVMMFSILACSHLQREKPVSLNILAFSALLQLFVCPQWLFDVGFQLSYASVAAIVLLQPRLSALWEPSHRLLRYLWGLLTASVAAQIGVAPLILYYFHQFPTHFLLSNLVVVPLMGLILAGGLAMLLLTPLPALQQWVADGVNLLLTGQHRFLRAVEQLPYANLDYLRIDAVEIILFYICIILTFRCISLFRARRCLAMLSAVLLLAVIHQGHFFLHAPRQGIAFYPHRHCPTAHCIMPDGTSWLVNADSTARTGSLERIYKGKWIERHLQQPQSVTASVRLPQLHFDGSWLCYAGTTLCFIDTDHWQWRQPSAKPAALDYLYLTPRYRGNVEHLTRLFDIGTVVIDASYSLPRSERLAQECLRLHLPYLEMRKREQGVFIELKD